LGFDEGGHFLRISLFFSCFSLVVALALQNISRFEEEEEW
jgi:hypothetical protein